MGMGYFNLCQVKNGYYRKAAHAAGVTVASMMMLLLLQCGGVWDPGRSAPSEPEAAGSPPHLTPAEKYAAEILSYLMQIVVGAAGDPTVREAWRTRSLFARPDYKEVVNIMSDPQRKVSELMVYDPNILGLSKVLFHYNERLNLFKGQALQQSVWPSEELLTIRLLMVQKIARGEKVRLGNLMARKALIRSVLVEPSQADLDSFKISYEELKLLRDVVHAEPFFMAYLEDPFLVDALYRVGLVEMDAYVLSKILAADYGDLAERYPGRKPSSDVVRVAILPSMIGTYDFAEKGSPGYPMGFRATDDYTRAIQVLKHKLMASLQQRILGAMPDAGGRLPPEQHGAAVADAVHAHLRFLELDKRPLVIYPGNAEAVIGTLCPDADFSFIILGKNVYLSVPLDEKKDTLPAVNRIYLDIDDVDLSDADYDIDRVAGFLLNRLEPLARRYMENISTAGLYNED